MQSLQQWTVKKISYDYNSFQSNNLPDPIRYKLIKLSAPSEILSRRNRKIILRYRKPNKEILPDKYAHCLLILLYPLTDEKPVVANGSYVSKLNEENVLEIITQNKHIWAKFRPYWQLQERNTYQDDNLSIENIDFAVEASNIQVHNSIDCSAGRQQIASVQVDDNDLRKALCSLNLRQHKTFNIVCHWTKNNVVEPLHWFITGDAGFGKSHVIKIVTSFLTKSFNLYSVPTV